MKERQRTGGWKKIIRVIAFFMIFFLLLGVITPVFMNPDSGSKRIVSLFLDAPADSLDAIYIGSSNAFTYWEPLLVWEQYGFAVQTLATSHNPFYNTEDIIKTARKTQSDPLFIVNINTLSNVYTPALMRAVIDSFPTSWDKIRMTWNMSIFGRMSAEDTISYYFPIMRYHTRWNELTTADFTETASYEDFKGASASGEHFTVDADISKRYRMTDEVGELTFKQRTVVNFLLEYCDREHLNMLFVIVPQSKSLSKLAEFNAVCAMIREHGYPILNLLEQPDEVGLDLTMDLKNNAHTNVHGSSKVSLFIADYLASHYDFTDKRGQEEYRSWDEALEKYNAIAAPYLLDIEHIPLANNAKTRVTEVTAAAGETGADLSWTPSEGADGYLVYRKETEGSPWMSVTDSTEALWTDPEGKPGTFYTVVPYKDGEKREYGSFIHAGVQAK